MPSTGSSSSSGARAAHLVARLVASSGDLVAVATEARALFADVGDHVRTRWLDLELRGFGALTDAHPLHDVLGVAVGDELARNVAGYRTQVGRAWANATGRDQVAHFFVEPLAEIIAARDRLRAASVTGMVELSFGAHAGAPDYPASADFPADVFERILLGFAVALREQLEGPRV